MKRFVCLIVAFFGFVSAGWAETVSLVLDLNQEPELEGAQPSEMVEVDGTLYFVTNSPGTAGELWKSDGTLDRTSKVKSFWASNLAANPVDLVAVNGMLFFRADNGIAGQELWKSDGTPEGTVMLKDIVPGSGSSSPSELVNVNGTLFFRACDNELWRSDGTEQGTYLVRSFPPATYSNRIQSFTVAGGTLYFRADDGFHGVELWKSDGTTNGTVLVKDIEPAIRESSYPSELVSVGPTLYFCANTGAYGTELWKSDGTEEGTVLVGDIVAGSGSSSPFFLTDVNGTLFFYAKNGAAELKLWTTDGTAEGTTAIRDLPSDGSSSKRLKPVNVNGTLFFQHDDGVAGPELWKSDGTTDGTVLVADIVAGSAGSYPTHLVAVNGMAFFLVSGSHSGYELWRSDGTGAGTIGLRDLWTTVDDNSTDPILVSANGKLFFRADDGTSGVELFKSDGSPEGTVIVRNIVAGSAGSNPRVWATLDGIVLFEAEDGLTGDPTLWKSDGTIGGTEILNDAPIRSGVTSGSEFAVVGGTMFYRALDPGIGYELWKSDGTTQGTVRVKGAALGAGFNPSDLVDVNGVLFFSASDLASGRELWTSDGTPDGTVRVKDIAAGAAGSEPSEFVDVNGTVFFRARDDEFGDELWKSDGTPEGTRRVKDINPGLAGSSPSHLIRFNGMLYFTAENGASGRELWKSDGTPEGTVVVRDIAPGFQGSNPSSLAVAGGNLYFSAQDNASGYELWKSDGTAEGTVKVKDINPGDEGSWPSKLVGVNGLLYFTAFSETAGLALWRSDGSVDGTIKLIDGLAGVVNGQPSNLTNVDGILYFTMNDGVSGTELWKSDGTPEGTVLALDLVPGADGANPVGLIPAGDQLFVTAQLPGIGSELVRVSTTDLSAPPVITNGLVSGMSTSAVTIEATATANRLPTSVHVEYGTSVSLGANTSAQQIDGAGVHNLFIKLPGLSKNTTYYYRTVAVNEMGSSQGEIRTFRIDAAAPTVDSVGLPIAKSSYAKTSVEISPNGAPTHVWIEYGTDSYTSFSTAKQYIESGGTQRLQFTLSDLAPYRLYSYRVVAANSEGLTSSNVFSFTSAPGRPVADVGLASEVTGTTANVSATVTANAATTSVRIKYSSPGGVALQTASQTVSGTSPQTLSFSLSGLANGTEYRYQVLASNSAGVGESETRSFTTLPEAPLIVHGNTVVVGLGSAEVLTKVNPNGAATSVQIEYGTTVGFGLNSAVQTVSGAAAEALSFTLSGLEPSTLYYYRVVATNTIGSSYSHTGTFTTYRMNATVVQAGYGAPGSGWPDGPPLGSLLWRFGTPALSDNRILASRVTLKAREGVLQSIYLRHETGSDSTVALEGGAVPGVVGGRFHSFLDPLLTPGGAVGFSARIRGKDITSANDQGFWSTAFSEVLQPLLREGSEVPGVAPGARLKAFPSVSLKDGELLALVTLARGKGGVTQQNDKALLRVRSSGTEVLVREGELLAVDDAPASRVVRFSTLIPAPGSPGHGRWHAEGGQGVAKLMLANKEEVVVRWTAEGDLVPVFSSGSELEEIGAGARWQKLGLPSIGVDGTGIAISGQLTVGVGGVSEADDAVLVYRAKGAPVQLVAREGMNAPGVEGGSFASFSDPVVGAGRELAFTASLKGSGIGPANQSGLWWGTSGGELALVAQVGGWATDQSGAVVAGRQWKRIVSYALPGGNGAGPIFVARVKGAGVNAKNDLGLWAVDSRGLLRELLRTGTPLYGAYGKTLRSFRVLSAVSGSSGASRTFNSARTVAIQAIDSSNTQSLIRISLP